MPVRLSYFNRGVLGLALGLLALPLSTQFLPVDPLSQTAAAGANLSASVPDNPYNTLAQQLADKEAQLNAQQAQMNAQGASRTVSPQGINWGFWSLCTSAALFVLVALNFYFDIRRDRPKGTPNYSINLR